MRNLIYGSILTGPIFIILTVIQIIFTPDFFQLTTMESSLLGTIKFILTGMSLIIGGIGLTNLLSDNQEGKIGAIFLGIGGVGLTVVGIIFYFEEGLLYNFLYILANTLGYGQLASCLVFTKYFETQKNWFYFSIATAIIVFLAFLCLLFLPILLAHIPLVLASFVLFSWVSLISVKIMKQPATYTHSNVSKLKFSNAKISN